MHTETERADNRWPKEVAIVRKPAVLDRVEWYSRQRPLWLVRKRLLVHVKGRPMALWIATNSAQMDTRLGSGRLSDVPNSATCHTIATSKMMVEEKKEQG